MRIEREMMCCTFFRRRKRSVACS